MEIRFCAQTIKNESGYFLVIKACVIPSYRLSRFVMVTCYCCSYAPVICQVTIKSSDSNFKD